MGKSENGAREWERGRKAIEKSERRKGRRERKRKEKGTLSI
jgi:hypothetical protein